MALAIEANIFLDIGIVLIVATVFAYLLRLLRQPLIPAYILAGVLIGPQLFGLITNVDLIKVLAELGVAFLLFMVGLEIDFSKLKEVKFVSLVGGSINVLLLFTIGFFVALMFGFVSLEAVYLGFVLAFSSTMVVVKLLSDSNELGTLHGRIILGILLLQDIVAIFALSFLAHSDFSFGLITVNLLKGIGLFIFVYLISKFVLPSLFRFSARSQELLFLSAISVLFFFSLFALSIGYSVAIGAFLAGLGLANLPYNFDIAGTVRPLRDFFATLFFVSLGMQIIFTDIANFIAPLIVLFLLVIILKPFMILFFTSLFGYKTKTSVLSGISLGQTSEFSLILVAQGLLLQHISSSVFSLTILLTILTMALTPYFIDHKNWVFKRVEHSFGFLSTLPTHRERLEYHRNNKKEVLLFGSHRMGSILLKGMKNILDKVFVVDYNPGIIRALMKEKVSCLYGEVTNEEILGKVNFRQAKLLISTIPDLEDNLIVLDHVKKINPKIVVISTADYIQDAFTLYNAKADYVILPQFLTGENVSSLVKNLVKGKKDISKLRSDHVKYLLDIDVVGDHL